MNKQDTLPSKKVDAQLNLKSLLKSIAALTEEQLREVELACAVRRSDLRGKEKDKVDACARGWYQALVGAAAPHIFPQWIPFRRSSQFSAFNECVPSLDMLARAFVGGNRTATHVQMQSIRMLICEYVVKHASRIFPDAQHHTFLMTLKQAHAVIDAAFPGYRSSDLLPMVAKARFNR